MWAKIWPRGLVGRIMVVMLAAIVVEFAANAFIYMRAEEFRESDIQAQLLVERLTLAERLLKAEPAQRWALAADTLSTPDLFLGWSARMPELAQGRSTPDSEELRTVLLSVPALNGRILSLVESGTGRERLFSGVLTIGPESFLVFQFPDENNLPVAVTHAAVSALSVALFVLLAGLAVVRGLATPLQQLTRSVDAFAGQEIVKVVAHGPPDVVRLASAFRAMQDRIIRLVEDRTRSLAAISHDLRTPLSRMRLRAGLSTEPDLRRDLDRDIAELEALIDSILTYVGEEADTDARERVNVASLLATIADDASDLGQDVAYDGPPRAYATVQLLSFRRAISNLVGNALVYAGMARLRLAVRDQTLIVQVEDDGPGVPEDMLARLADPFLRLDEARQRNTTGAGLGLSIVKQVIERHDGTLTLSNRPEGGFRAELAFPQG